MKKYLIFDFDGTLVQSNSKIIDISANYLKRNFKVDIEQARYILSTSRGAPMREVIKEILKISDEKAKEIASDLYEVVNEQKKSTFFHGVPEIIKRLHEKYTLFVSTGNSTFFAKYNLQHHDLLEYFTYVIGSEEVLKGNEHIEIFKSITGDEDFGKRSVFIGDGEKDRAIAKDNNIDFIHIDDNLKNEYNDTYEIASVKDIESILEKLNK